MSITVEDLQEHYALKNPNEAQLAKLQRAIVVITNNITIDDLIFGTVSAHIDEGDDEVGKHTSDLVNSVANAMGRLLGTTTANPLESARLFARIFTAALFDSVKASDGNGTSLQELMAALESAAVEAASDSTVH